MERASFPVLLGIGSEYLDTSSVVALPPGDSTVVSFSEWSAGPTGTLAVRCSTLLDGDGWPDNDKAEVHVYVQPLGGTFEHPFGGRRPGARPTVLADPVLATRSRVGAFSITGRKVMDLHPGENDIHHLSPGIYFIREEETRTTRKVIVTR